MTPAPAPSPREALDAALSRRPGVVWPLVAACVALGALLRFEALGQESLWLDEILQSSVTQKPFSWMWHHLHGYQGDNGPLDYLLQHVWLRWFGTGEFNVRAPAAAWGSLTVFVAFLWARAAVGSTGGLLAALAVALSPFHVRYSQEARPYALFLLLLTVSLWALVNMTRAQRPGRWAPVYFLAAVGAAATHLFALFQVTMHLLWLVLLAWQARHQPPNPDRLRHAIRTVCVSLCVCALLLVPRLMRAETIHAETTITFDTFTWGQFLDLMVTHFFGIDRVNSNGVLWAALPLAALGAISLVRRRSAIAVLMMILVVGSILFPLLLCIAIDHWFVPRYTLPALLPLLLLETWGLVTLLDWLAAKCRRATLIYSALLVLTLLVLAPLMANWIIHHRKPKEDYRGLAQWLHTAPLPGHHVLSPNYWDPVCLSHYLVPLGATANPEMFYDHATLMRRANDIAPCFVLLKTWEGRSDLRRRLWGFPHLKTGLTSMDLWWCGDTAQALRTRPDLLEQTTRRFAENGLRLSIGHEPLLALGHGWGDAEGIHGGFYFRWCTTTSPRLNLPLADQRGRAIVWKALAYDWGGAPAQSTEVWLNGQLLGRGITEPSWREYAVEAPVSFWRMGLNELEFRIDHCPSPQEKVGNEDWRPLGIALAWLELRESGLPHSNGTVIFSGPDEPPVSPSIP